MTRDYLQTHAFLRVPYRLPGHYSPERHAVLQELDFTKLDENRARVRLAFQGHANHPGRD